MKATPLVMLLVVTLASDLAAQVRPKPKPLQKPVAPAQFPVFEIPQATFELLPQAQPQQIKLPNLQRFQVQPQPFPGFQAPDQLNWNVDWVWHPNAAQNLPQQVRDYAMKQIEQMRLTCRLSEKQVRTLRVAAKGVAHRLKQEHEAKKTVAQGQQPAAAVVIWGRNQQLNGQLSSKLNSHSLWKRTLARVLTEEQRKQWAQVTSITAWPGYGNIQPGLNPNVNGIDLNLTFPELQVPIQPKRVP